MALLTLRMFGPPRAERDGSPVRFETRKAMALLSYLALSDGPISRDALIGLLWPDFDQAHAQGDLRRALSSLRKALGEEVIESTRQIIALNKGLVTIDVQQFRNDIKHAQMLSEEARLSQLEEAVSLWRGEFMADFIVRDSGDFEDWQLRTAEHLRRELSTALYEIVHGYEAKGNISAAIPHARRLLELDLLNEDAHRLLMRLYAQAGRRTDALKQYQNCEQILAAELGVQPLEETAALFAAIKDGASYRTTLQPASLKPATHLPLPSQALPKLPFIGREREWAMILGAQQTWHAQGYWIAIEGEPGIGKTRLLNEFADQNQARLILRAYSYEGESGFAYEPVIQVLRQAVQSSEMERRLKQLPTHWLTELARLLPELSPSTQQLAVDEGAKARLFEAIRQAFIALHTDQGLGLIFDDLHWADTSTIEVLNYLVRRLNGTGLVLLTAWRDEANENTRLLRRTLAEAQRTGHSIHLVLKRLSSAQVSQLCQHLGGDSATYERKLFQESEGIPLLLEEYVRALELTPAQSDGQWPLPDTVRGLLQSRVGALGQVNLQVAQTAAAVGRTFTHQLIQRTSGRNDEEVAHALESLTLRGLIRALSEGVVGSPTYAFSHEKLREFIYVDTHIARRQLLHQRIALTLVDGLKGNRIGESSANIARHFELAGNISDAAVHYADAGEFAQNAFANAEALAHYRSALRLGYAQPAHLHHAIADLLTLRGDFEQALEAYHTAAGLSQDRHEQATIAQALANVLARLGDWAQAETHFQTALQMSDSQQMKSSVLADWSRTVHAQADDIRAYDLAQRALALAKDSKDARALARAHNVLGLLSRSQNQFAQARTHFEESLAMARQMGDVVVQTAVTNNLALAYRDQNEITAALRLTEEALRLCEAYGDRHREAALRSNLADLFNDQGDVAAAMAQLQQSAVIFAEIGLNASTQQFQPEVWKLTEW